MGLRYFCGLQKLDSVLHRLHGRHLVPRWFVRPICDRYEALLLAADPSDDDWVNVPPAVMREWDNADDAVYDEGQRITDAINADPAEVERLTRAREDARAGRTYPLSQVMAEVLARDNDFYEEDEPVHDVLAAFNRGEKHLTAPREEPFMGDT